MLVDIKHAHLFFNKATGGTEYQTCPTGLGSVTNVRGEEVIFCLDCGDVVAPSQIISASTVEVMTAEQFMEEAEKERRFKRREGKPREWRDAFRAKNAVPVRKRKEPLTDKQIANLEAIQIGAQRRADRLAHAS